MTNRSRRNRRSDKSTRRHLTRKRKLGVEPLEDRCMLAADFGDAPDQIGDVVVAEVADISRGDSFPQELTVFDDRLFFAARKDSLDRIRTNVTLFVFDPASGVSEIELETGPLFRSPSPSEFTKFDGRLFFAANGPNGNELFVFDPVSGDVTEVADINPGRPSSNPRNFGDRGFTEFDGRLFFAGNGPNGRELFVFDPASGVSEVDINPGLGGSSPVGFTEVDGRLFFAATGPNGRELFMVDPAGGVSEVADIRAGTDSSGPFDLTEFDGRLFFAATGPNGRELFVFDPASGLSEAADINPGPDGSFPIGFTEFDGRLFFSATDPNGSALFAFDPASGVSEVGQGFAPANFTEFDGRLFFSSIGPNGSEPFVFNPATGVVSELADINPGPDDSFPEDFTEFDGLLFFRAIGPNGDSLFMFDPAGGVSELAGGVIPQGFTEFDGRLFFSAFGPGGYELNALTVSPRRYPTLLVNNGAQHEIVAGGPSLGTTPPDAESDGQPSPAALGDDNGGNDDEDVDGIGGVVVIPGQPLTGLAFEHDGGASGALLSAWIDLNRDGDWDDTDEQFLVDVPVPSGTGTTALDAITLPASAALGTTFIRTRISTQPGLAPSGAAADGEVEDFQVAVQLAAQQFDFGDAPDSYDTTLLNDGARHVGVGPTIGAARDAEPDAQAPLAGTGDDVTNTGSTNDDRDGVHFFVNEPPLTNTQLRDLMIGRQMRADVTIRGSDGDARLYGWIDFNADGDFEDSGEQVADGTGTFANLSDGILSVPFDVPDTAPDDETTYARFRVSTDEDLSWDGLATDGEVQDSALRLTRGLYVNTVSFSRSSADHITNEANLQIPGIDPSVLDSIDLTDETAVTAALVAAGVDSSLIDFSLSSVVISRVETTTSTLERTISDDAVIVGDGDGGFIITQGITQDRINTNRHIDTFITDTLTITIDLDYGDAPDSYATTLLSDGARHVGVGPMIGSERDIEPDAQAPLDGTGDDVTDTGSVNDEGDGVEFFDSELPGLPLPNSLGVNRQMTADVTINGSDGNARLYGWIDFNADGDFDDPGEQIADGTGSFANLPDGVVGVPFDVPDSLSTTAANGTNASEGGSSVSTSGISVPEGVRTFARFRVTTNEDVNWDGLATDGEVHDIALNLGPGLYLITTSSSTSSADHITNVADLQIPGVDSVVLDGVDLTDEAAVIAALVAAGVDESSIGFSSDSVVIAQEDTITQTTQRTISDDAVIVGDEGGGFILVEGIVRDNINTNTHTDTFITNTLTITGEVVPEFDFGDAPNSYLTFDASGGPKHEITSDLFMGAAPPDADTDGFGDGVEDNPNTASDDDTEGDAPDDEDGITGPITLDTSQTTFSINVTVSNTTGGDANLVGWIDFDGNGTFDPDEVATTIVASAATSATLTWNDIGSTGPDIVAGETFARFRLTTDAIDGDDPGGAASNGEVEDYALTIEPGGPNNEEPGVTLSNGKLTIVGTDDKDWVKLYQIRKKGWIVVRASFLDRKFVFKASEVNCIDVFLHDGNDFLHATNVRVPIRAFGGDGHDRLIGGKGNDRLFGEDGNDKLIGGFGNDALLGGRGHDFLIGAGKNDLLVGGLGRDKLYGAAGDDILIGGSTIFDDDLAAIDAIMAEWGSQRTAQQRMDNLRGVGSGPSLNGTTFLIAGSTVLDDGQHDKLHGSQGIDWIFAEAQDDDDLHRGRTNRYWRIKGKSFYFKTAYTHSPFFFGILNCPSWARH